MHTRRESGRDVNRGEKATPPPPRPPPHARTAFRPPPGPAPEGWRGPCPPLCSAAGTAARRARLHGQRGARWAHTHAHAPPRGWGARGGCFTCHGAGLHYAPPRLLRPRQHNPRLSGLCLGAFFFFSRGGWMAGSVPTTTTSSTAGQGLQLCRHLFNEAVGIYFFSPPISLGKRFTLRAVIKSRPTYIPANPASSTRAALSIYCPPLCLQG